MPTATRTFRVFVSSTFEDLKEERNVLQAKVFPKLEKFCLEKGARFQAIDLRWGVREEAGLDHKTMEICLAEIARCQKTGIKPNFIVLLGGRYGWRPLPARIEKNEFDALLAHVITDQRRLLVFEEEWPAANNGWYRLDRNADPPQYLLKPREGEYEERSTWEPLETHIRETLQKAARAASLPKEELVKYEASATHQEILAGTKPEEREHVFAFVRNPDERKDAELRHLIETLRRRLPEGNVHSFSEGNLDVLCQQVLKSLKPVIEAEASRFQSRSALEQEREAHKAFAQDRCTHFVGRDTVRTEIKDYVNGTHSQPLVVFGPSGSGKSAIIARASEEHEGIRRFIGATPEASNGLTLLRSLCQEIGERYAQTGELPATFNQLAMLFEERLRLATADRPLTLYIDALDQLSPQDPASAANWLPGELPSNCRIVLSTIDVPTTLTHAKLVPVEPFSVAEASTTLDLWLKDAKRSLQDTQREKLLESFRQSGLPLYLKLAFEEARLWRAFDPMDKCVLGDGLAGITDRLFSRLAERGNHGNVLVSHALGLLTAARYGLTEDEILNVLATNDAVWADFARSKKHDLPQDMLADPDKQKRQLPAIVWSRLYLDLEPYLTERAVPGGTTISFYHRQLAERVAPGKSHHAQLAAYFTGQPSNERRLTELVRQQIGAELLDDAEATLTDLDFISAKCASDLVFDLQEDYHEAMAALPEAEWAQHEEMRLNAGLERWAQDLADYVRLYSEWRARQTRAGFLKRLFQRSRREPAPELPEIIHSVKPWTDQQITAEANRIADHHVRLDRLKAFSYFLQQEIDVLIEFGGRRGFLIQHAWNNAPAGPVHAAAAARVDSAGVPLLTRHWPPGSLYNSRPACLRRIEGHGDHVNSVCITADGKRIISRGWDYALRVWDLETGRCLQRLNIGHDACETPNGRLAVSLRGELQVWDLETGACVRSMGIKRIKKSVRLELIAVTTDARLAVFADYIEPDRSLVFGGKGGIPIPRLFDSGDGTEEELPPHKKRERPVSYPLRVWDLEKRSWRRPLSGHTDRVTSLAVAADGRRAVSASFDETLRVWDLETGLCLRVLEEAPHFFDCVSITPDGRSAIAGSFSSIRLWDLDTGHCLRIMEGHHSSIKSVSVTPDARLAVSGGSDRTIRLWDLETGECLRLLEGHSSEITSVSVTADGRRAVSGSGDHSIRVWDLETGRSQRVVEGDDNPVNNVALLPDGRVLSASYNALRLWDLATGECRQTWAVRGSGVDKVCVTSDGRRAVSKGNMEKTLKIWDLNTGECVRVLEGHSFPIITVCLTPSGRGAVSGGYDKTLRVWDLETGECKWILDGHTGWVNSVSVSPDGHRAISTAWDTFAARIWDLETGRCLRLLEGHTNRISRVWVSPDGKHAMTASEDSTLRVWDLETGQCLRLLSGHTDKVMNLKVMLDGHRAVSTGFSDLRVWDLETGECLQALERYHAFNLGLCLTPDGQRAITAGVDATLGVWDLQTGICLAIVRLESYAIAIVRYGDRIVAGTVGGEVQLFDIRNVSQN